MAKMYPETLPNLVLHDPKRSSEVRVYECLKSNLPGDYQCFYSRSWHAADADGAEYDGEADFIIAHARHGLLFIEVKGGRVSRRASDEQWLSTDRDGLVFRIKDPIAQARSSKHHFVRRLRKEKSLGGRFIRARHAAVLPGSARPTRPLAADAPLNIIAFGNDMADLGSWVAQRMSENEDLSEEPLGVGGLSAVNDLLKGHFELRAHIGVNLAEDAEEIERLTAEQAWILDSFEDNQEMAISGGAGSGKTVLAVEKAIRSAAMGRRTLLTCFNAPLAAHLHSTCGRTENLVVASFHSLCGKLAEAAGVALPPSSTPKFYDQVLPEALAEALAQVPELNFDTIIVDEGQDFRDQWLNALRLALRSPDDSEFYVFYDDNQRLYGHAGEFLAALPQSRLPLTRNLRNTQRIHALMSKWYKGRQSRAFGPEGQPIGWIECRNADMARGRVAERITQLLNSGQATPDQIAVLSGGSTTLPDRIAGVPTCKADDMRTDMIVCDTIRRFKGLSRPCIFLVDIEEPLNQEICYVATSRANLLLEVAGTKGALDLLRGTEAGD